MKKLFVAAILAITVAACGPDVRTPEPQAQTPEAQTPVPPPGMVLIPAGSFLMGDGDGQDMEKPVHEVELDAFYMDTHEVTLEQFGQFVQATSYVTDAEKNDGSIIWNGEDFEKTEGINWRFDAAGNAHTAEEDNQPVTHLSWNDATAYAQWVDKRLPTEAEWEYAARGGEKGYKFAWGNEPLGEAVVANVSDEGYVQVVTWPYTEGYDDGYVFGAPVGSFPPNAFGLYDMSGNAWEWCADYFDPEYYSRSPKTNPRNDVPDERRAMRGNSWDGRPGMMRASRRTSDLQSNSYADTGFRLVKDIESIAVQAAAPTAPRRILYEAVIEGQSEVMLTNEDGTGSTRLTDHPGYDGMPSWTSTGDILFVSDRDSEGKGDVYRMTADGSDMQRITTDGAGYSFPKLSPDGQWIGFDASRGGDVAQVWVMRADGTDVRQVSPSDVDEGYVSWTADSRALVYDSFRDGPPEIYRGEISTGEVTRLTFLEEHIGDPQMSPDGTLLTFESGRDGNSEIYVTNADGTEPRRLTDNPADDRASAISHDNSRVVFASDRDGEREAFELWVMNIDGSDLRKLTDTGASNLYASFEPRQQQR